MLKYPYLFLLVLISSFTIASCATPSPRFRAIDEKQKPSVATEDEAAFSAKVKEEEAREDDKKVDLSQIQAKLEGAVDTSISNNRLRDKVLLDVVDFLGTPYMYGGSTKQGMDCSGFTFNVFSNALHKQLPRSTKEQFNVGVEIDRSELRFGDLVFFNTTGRSPSHVGIYIENDLFAHASVSYGVTFSSLESTYYKKRFVGARRVAE